MDLNRAFRKAILDQEVFDFTPMVTLKQDKSVLRGSTACTVGFQLGTQIAKVDTLRIYAFDNCRSFTPFPSFEADLDKLLLHTDGSADT
jgi:hypothetical protein